MGSNQGLSEYDTQIAQPTLADEDKERAETEAVLAKLKAALAQEKQKEVAQDLQIVIRRIELQFREDDFQRAHEVPFLNASGAVFSGLRILLDEQTANDRRAAAVARIRKYAGLKPGYTPLTEILKQRVKEQMAKPDVVYPSTHRDRNRTRPQLQLTLMAWPRLWRSTNSRAGRSRTKN